MIGEDDLSTIWAGARALLVGADPYDPATWRQTAVALGTQLPDTAVYGYPGWIAVALVPLGLIPLPVLSWAWLAASFAAAALSLRAALRWAVPGRPFEHAVGAVTLFASWSWVLNMVLGQWGGLLIAALFGGASAVRAGRPRLAALAMLAFLAKPQLFVLAAPAYAVRAVALARGRGIAALGIAATVTLALVAVSLAVLPGWPAAWREHVLGARIAADSDTIAGLLGTAFGRAGQAAGLVFIGVGALAGLAFHPLSAAWLPVWIAISIGVAPYSNSYDKALLVVPLVLAAGALRERPARARAVLVAGAAVMVVLTPAMYAVALLRRSETFSPLVTVLIVAIVLSGVWSVRRAPGPADS